MKQPFDQLGRRTPHSMPDIANDVSPTHQGTLNWVGMSQIHMPFQLNLANHPQSISANVDAYVSLEDPAAKGIHMSRLYLALEALSAEQTLSPQSIQALLQDFLNTHESLSQAANVIIRFPFHLQRASLLSGKSGWKAYPTELDCQLIQGQFHFYLRVKVDYSSTCPCSAALARQLIQQAFKAQFENKTLSVDAVTQWLGTTEGIVATPHSQRSTADIKVKLENINTTEFPIQYLIDAAEEALQTPVQAAVKREDEQEFARLNGQHPMFCEDAARILKAKLNQLPQVNDFRIRVNHYESLHAHDAVAIVTKGIPGGLLP